MWLAARRSAAASRSWGSDVAVEVVAFSTSLSAAQASISLPWPAGHQAGDIGVVIQGFQMTAAGTASPSVPLGWEKIAITNENVAPRCRMLWKRATSSAESNVTLSYSSMNINAARMVVLRGCVAEGPPVEIGLEMEKYAGIAVPTMATGGAHCWNDGSLLLHGAFQQYDSTAAISSGWVANNVGNMTELFDSGSTVGAGANLGAAWCSLDGVTQLADMDVTSSQGNNYSYRVGAIFIPEGGTARAPVIEEVAHGSASTNYATAIIPAGACEAGDLLIVFAVVYSTAGYRTLTLSLGGVVQVPGDANAQYSYSSMQYMSQVAGYAVATGLEQSIKCQANLTSNSTNVYVFRVKNFKNSSLIESKTDRGTTTAGRLPAMAAANFHIHLFSAASDNGGYGMPYAAGYSHLSRPVQALYGVYENDCYRATKSPEAAAQVSMPLTGANGFRSWQTISMGFNGDMVTGGGGGGAGGGLFWGNNF